MKPLEDEWATVEIRNLDLNEAIYAVLSDVQAVGQQPPAFSRCVARRRLTCRGGSLGVPVKRGKERHGGGAMRIRVISQ